MNTINKTRLEKARMHGLVYRLRKKGIEIDSKQQMIPAENSKFMSDNTKIGLRAKKQIRRLIEEFGFKLEQKEEENRPKVFVDWNAVT